MGEHKHNSTAIAAKADALPPKPKPVGKVESMRRCRRWVHDYLYKNTALGVIEREIGMDNGTDTDDGGRR